MISQINLKDLIKNGDDLLYLFNLKQINLSESGCQCIFESVQDKLEEIIQSPFELSNLFRLPSSVLSDANRTVILNAIRNKLNSMLDAHNFVRLLELTEEQLSPGHRELILKSTIKDFNKICSSFIYFFQILCLPNQKLPLIYREEIFKAIAENSKPLFFSMSDLNLLSQLTEAHLPEKWYEYFWNQIKGDSFSSHIHSVQDLLSLFQLKRKPFSMNQRNDFLIEIKDRLPIIITEGEHLSRLFQLDEELLSSAHRELIINSLLPILDKIIKNGHDYFEVFQLSEKQLPTNLRKKIHDMIQFDLNRLIGFQHDLFYISSLPINQFTLDQYEQLKDYIANINFHDFIRNFDHFIKIFKLPMELLSSEIRDKIIKEIDCAKFISFYQYVKILLTLSQNQLSTKQLDHILNALKDYLPNLISTVNQFCALFEINKERLSQRQCELIFEAVVENFKMLIKNTDQLIKLFELSEDRLSIIQRDRILDVLKQDLSTIIENKDQLDKLFKLTDRQLSIHQRNFILTVLCMDKETKLEAIPNPNSIFSSSNLSNSASKTTKSNDDDSHHRFK